MEPLYEKGLAPLSDVEIGSLAKSRINILGTPNLKTLMRIVRGSKGTRRGYSTGGSFVRAGAECGREYCRNLWVPALLSQRPRFGGACIGTALRA